MAETANEAIFNAEVRHQVDLQRYSQGLVRRTITILNKADADLVGKIERTAPEKANGWTNQRRKAVLDGIRTINKQAYQRVGKALTSELNGLAPAAARFSAATLKNSIPIEFDVTMPSSQLLQSVVTSQPFRGKLLKDWFTDLEEGRFKRMRDAIQIGIVEGETIDQMVQRIRGTRANGYKDGILEMSRRDAAAVVRTSVNHTTTRAREILYEENTDLVKGVEWISTLDGRTTPVCRARDGKVFKPGEGPRPPAHINCRSTTVPQVKSWRELGIDLDEAPPGTRAAMDGQIAQDKAYGDWLRTQDRSFVEEILGKKKAALFLEGKLPIDRFVNEGGRELTLEELHAKYSEAWNLAFGGTPDKPAPAPKPTLSVSPAPKPKVPKGEVPLFVEPTSGPDNAGWDLPAAHVPAANSTIKAIRDTNWEHLIPVDMDTGALLHGLHTDQKISSVGFTAAMAQQYQQAGLAGKSLHMIHSHPLNPSQLSSGVAVSNPLSSTDIVMLFRYDAFKRVSAFGADGSYFSAEKITTADKWNTAYAGIPRRYHQYFHKRPEGSDPTDGFMSYHALMVALHRQGLVRYSFGLMPTHKLAFEKYQPLLERWIDYWEQTVKNGDPPRIEDFFAGLKLVNERFQQPAAEAKAVLEKVNRGAVGFSPYIAMAKQHGYYAGLSEKD